MKLTPLVLMLSLALPLAAAEPTWFGYGGNAQHTANSSVAALPIESIFWQTPVDEQPQYSGSDLFIHYASPMATAANTIIVPVKTGAAEGFSIRGFNGDSAAQKWSLASDFILPPHGSVWVPSFPATLTKQNRLYFAGAGGTLYYVDSPDASGATVTGQVAFYGLANYTANKVFCDANIFISSPLTADSAGNIYFSFISTSNATLSLVSGLARVDASGNGTFVTALAAGSNDSSIAKPVYNCAPALSPDETSVYIAVSDITSTFGHGRLAVLTAATLAPIRSVVLTDPSGSLSNLPDDGTASPVIGPDGDVYMGVLENPFLSNNDRGWLMHFSGDLLTQKITGAFGWDDTPSLVPASMVPSYTGSSTYLIASKYNNYAGVGSGDGTNKLAILDPNASQVDPITTRTIMKEVLTILGVTPDAEHLSPTFPNAVREWCINSAVVDPGTGSIYAGSEDGKLYQWNLTTNTFSSVVTLTPGIGEAYTPTLIGPNGVVYAINNATLFAVGTKVVFTSGPPPQGQLNAPYTFLVTASGLPAPVFTVSSGALPDGLSLSSSGTISGTPTKTGAFSGTFTATNLSSNANQNFKILINPDLRTLAAGKVGVNYAQGLTANSGLPAGAYTFALASGSSLPPGLQIGAVSGQLQGIPTGSGTYTFTLKASDATPNTYTVPFTVTFAAPDLVLTPSSLSSANVGTVFSQQFSASGGTAPYTFTVKSGALPPGLALTTSGLLSGIPTAEGNFAFTVQATDTTSGNGPYNVAADFSIVVDYAPVFASPPSFGSALAPGVITSVLVKNLTAQFSATVNPADATLAWNFGDGSPVVSGTPGATVQHTYVSAGTYTVSVTATNPRSGASATATLSVEVDASATLSGTEAIRMKKGAIKLSARQNRITLQGSIDLNSGEVISGAVFQVGVNGVSRAFTLDAKGRGKTSDSSIHLSFKNKKGVIAAQSAGVTVVLSGSDIRNALNTGVTTDALGLPTMVMVQFHLSGRTMTFIAPVVFKKAGATESALFGGK